MLVRLAIDATGFADIGTRDSVETRANQRLLAPYLARSAILIYANAADVSRTASAVAGLPQELRKLWTTLFTEMAALRPLALSRTLSELSGPTDLLEWSGHIAVALTSSAIGARVGLSDADGRVIDEVSDIEITRLATVDSQRLHHASVVQSTDLCAKQDRDGVWAERFEIAASTGAPVTILDRYAVDSLANVLRDGAPCGLAWFLGKLADGPKVSAHLITRARSRSDAGRLVADLRRLGERLPGTGIDTLSVTLASNHSFAAHSHPRQVRFGTVAIGLDKGLTTFDEQHCPQSTPCSLIPRSTAREREEEIERLALNGFRRHIVW